MQILGLVELTPSVRAGALAELAADRVGGQVFKSARVYEDRQEIYFSLLHEALQERDDGWLAGQLTLRGCMMAQYLTKTHRLLKTPCNAAELLAYGEFKRYYIRGVCVNALAHGKADVEFYRAHESMIHRAESDFLIGTTTDAEALLRSLRTLSEDGEPFNGPPCQFGSGLCVRTLAPIDSNDALAKLSLVPTGLKA